MNPWIELSTVIVEVIMLQYFYTSFFSQTKRFGLKDLFCFLSYGGVLFLSSFLIKVSFVRSFIVIALTYLAVKAYFRLPWLRVLYPTFLFFCSSVLSDVFCGAILHLGGIAVTDFMGDGPARLVYNGIGKLMHLLLLQGIITFSTRRYNDITVIHALPLLSCQILSIYICYQNFLALSYGASISTVILETVGLLYINVIICAYVETLNRSYENKREAEIAKQKLQIQTHYYRDIMRRQEETRSLWHDIKKYLAAMESMIRQDREIEARQCLDSVQSAFSDIEMTVDTGNTLVDSILSYGMKKARDANVQLDLKIWVDSRLDFPESDLFIIIGNTLDNAIEACAALAEQEERIVHINLNQKNHLLFYEIRNVYEQAFGKKAKGSIHGYGLRNVRTCVERNGGEMSVMDDKREFVVSIQLTLHS